MQTKKEYEKNGKRMRVIVVFLIMMGVFILAGVCTYIMQLLFAKTLYEAFVFDTIATSFLIIASLVLCIFFLYHILLILIKNPQNLKKASVLKFGVSGGIIFFISLWIIQNGTVLFIDSVKDTQDYANGEWKVEDLQVVDIDWSTRGGWFIETEEQEFFMEWETIPLQEGETYRFTYLKRTGTVLSIEDL